MFSLDLVDIGVTFASYDATGFCLCWSRCPLVVISDSGRYFEIIFALIPGHVAKDPLLIAGIRVHFVGQQRIW